MKQKHLEVLMPSKWRITAYLPEEIQRSLEKWAADENRSVSNLAATILINAVKQKEMGQDSSSDRSQ